MRIDYRDRDEDLKSILIHFIECNRGYHYNSIFDEIIKPRFDSIEILEDVLKSPIIKNTSNIIVGDSGAKIYSELLKRLLLVDSERVKSYLLNEFKKGS